MKLVKVAPHNSHVLHQTTGHEGDLVMSAPRLLLRLAVTSSHVPHCRTLLALVSRRVHFRFEPPARVEQHCPRGLAQ